MFCMFNYSTYGGGGKQVCPLCLLRSFLSQKKNLTDAELKELPGEKL